MTPLLELRRGDGLLKLWVARFGVEVEGLSFLMMQRPGAWSDRGWKGLRLAYARKGTARWWVEHSGPALHLLEAQGSALSFLPIAAQGLRSLSGLRCEALKRLSLGGLKSLSLRSWSLTEEPKPHGQLLQRLELRSAQGQLRALIRVQGVDRRVLPGFDPSLLLEESRRRRARLKLQAPVQDPGPDGPAQLWQGEGLEEEKVELRLALRQIGPCLLMVEGIWFNTEQTLLSRLNARRHFDLILKSAQID